MNSTNQNSNVLAIVGLVFGIVSIVASCCMGWVGCIPAIVGLICSILARKSNKSGMSLAGIICSVVGLVLGVIMSIAGAVFLAALAEMGYSF